MVLRRRRLALWRGLAVGSVVVALAFTWRYAVPRSASVSQPTVASLSGPVVHTREAALDSALAAIRVAAEAAQLEVRVALPLVAEHGLPVTARRLATCEARLADIISTVDRCGVTNGGNP